MPLPSKRYYPLFDEIRNHVFQWATDPDWRTLSPALVCAMQQVMNQLKVDQVLSKIPMKEDAPSDAKNQQLFIKIFRDRYLEFTDLTYDDAITPVHRLNIKNVITKLKEKGATISEYLEWFFDDWCTKEKNKELMPPGIGLCLKGSIVNAFLYQKADDLRIREQQLRKQHVSNQIYDIAVSLYERHKDEEIVQEFAQKLVDFRHEKVTPTHFVRVMAEFAKKIPGEEEVVRKCEQLLKPAAK